MNLALIILFDGGYTKKSSSDFHEPCEIMDYNHGKNTVNFGANPT